MSTGEALMFWITAVTAVAGACGLLLARKGVHAAVAMALTMLSLGINYIGQKADFVGVVQIFVYAGAVMMLFLFVVMLVGVDHSDSFIETLRGQRVAGTLLAAGLGAALIGSVADATLPKVVGNDRIVASGQMYGFGRYVFTNYIWVFETLSALLITAALGAMVLSHRERLRPRVTQRELAAKRVRENVNVSALPGPGVFARHNAVDTPALLPDGSPSELSVAKSIVARKQVDDPEQWEAIEAHFVKEIEEGSKR